MVLGNGLRAGAMVTVAFLMVSTSAAQTVWQGPGGGTASWFAPGNWSAGVPTSAIDARVDNTGTAEIAGGSAEADRLYAGYNTGGAVLQSAGTLNVADRLTLAYRSGSSGAYTLSGEAELIVGGLETIGSIGSGEFTQTGSAVHTVNQLYVGYGDIHNVGQGTLNLQGGTLSANHMIVGYFGDGEVFQSGGDVSLSGQNTGLAIGIDAGGVGRWELSGSATLSTVDAAIGRFGAGTVVQNGGSVSVGLAPTGRSMWLGEQTGATGVYELHSGQLDLERLDLGGGGVGTAGGTGRFTQTGGVATTTGPVVVGRSAGGTGELTVDGGAFGCHELEVGILGNGTVQVGPAGELTVGQAVRLGEQSAVSSASAGTVRLAGTAWENESTDPAALAGLNGLTVIVESGLAVASIEAAGVDKGAVDAGFNGNMALGRLEVGGADTARLVLADDTDNTPGQAGSDALYVDQLELQAGAEIDLAGLRLYYRNGGPARALTGGDANLDGAVDVGDLGILAGAWGTEDGSAGWAGADFNADLAVDVGDLGILAGHWGMTAEGVPEPATLTLMGLALAVASRRRHT
jgi:hypothetical protein